MMMMMTSTSLHDYDWGPTNHQATPRHRQARYVQLDDDDDNKNDDEHVAPWLMQIAEDATAANNVVMSGNHDLFIYLFIEGL